MSTGYMTTSTPRRPLTVCYLGRPVYLYIDAIAKRRRTHANPAPSTGGTAEEPTAS
jgi:hypothetical protein